MNVLLPMLPAVPLPAEDHRGPRAYGWVAAWLIVVSLFPILLWYVRRLDDGSDEPLGLVALALAVLLAWRDRHELLPTGASRSGGALLLLVGALSTAWLPPLIRAAAAVTGLAFFYGIHRRSGILALLLLSLPVVASLQFLAGYPMRAVSAGGAVMALNALGATAAREGTGILLNGVNHGVDPACSGIRMLWQSLVAAAALAALHRLSWKKSVGIIALGGWLTLPANSLRALLLVMESTGKSPLGFLSHEMTGLVCNAAVLAVLWWLAARGSHHGTALPGITSPVRRRDLAVLLLAAIAGPWLSLTSPRLFHPIPDAITERGFTFDGLNLPLTPLPATPMEQAFAAGFPGTLGTYRWGEREVILRRVTKATRQLHPSRDCLRAAGYETTDAVVEVRPDGQLWSRFTASRGGQRLSIHERIVSEADARVWTDVSAWFWAALFNPLNGPWRAETLIESN